MSMHFRPLINMCHCMCVCFWRTDVIYVKHTHTKTTKNKKSKCTQPSCAWSNVNILKTTVLECTACPVLRRSCLGSCHSLQRSHLQLCPVFIPGVLITYQTTILCSPSPIPPLSTLNSEVAMQLGLFTGLFGGECVSGINNTGWHEEAALLSSSSQIKSLQMVLWFVWKVADVLVFKCRFYACLSGGMHYLMFLV